MIPAIILGLAVCTAPAPPPQGWALVHDAPRAHRAAQDARGHRIVAHGRASWLRYRPGHAAAGPSLRAALGRGWRGTRVTVCGRAGCASVVLSGWMRSADKLVDLDASDFRAVCGSLSRGVCRVSVQR